MNTNDPAATYGKPMLSDEEITNETWVPDMANWEQAGAYEAGMHWARRFYENLIREGRLRVVEEVGLTPNSYDCLLTCSGCHEGVPYYLAEEFADCKYCPNCGSIIKPTNP